MSKNKLFTDSNTFGRTPTRAFFASLFCIGLTACAAPSGMPAAPDAANSKIGMFIGIAVGAVVLLAAIAYLISRRNKGGDGQSGSSGGRHFDANVRSMDYDESAFLADWEQQMSPKRV